ncbi:MAG: hypothetical protein ABIP03_00370 [Aquihabitans sp.]
MTDGEIRVWTWDVLGPAGKRVWTLMFACYYLDAQAIPRPGAVMALVAAAAEAWQQEKDRDPEVARKHAVRSGQVSSGSWLQGPPASTPTEDIPSSAMLSDHEHALVKGGQWETCDRKTQEALLLKMAVMQHLAEFDAAPADLVAGALQAETGF